jgi:hypothetical protein
MVQADQPGVRILAEARDFSARKRPDRLSGHRGFFLGGGGGVKQLRSEADHSHTSGAKVTNEWSYTSTPSIRLHGVDRDNFAFNYLYLKRDNLQVQGWFCVRVKRNLCSIWTNEHLVRKVAVVKLYNEELNDLY